MSTATEVYQASVLNIFNETVFSSEFVITVSGLDDMVAAHLTFSHPVDLTTVVILDAVSPIF